MGWMRKIKIGVHSSFVLKSGSVSSGDWGIKVVQYIMIQLCYEDEE